MNEGFHILESNLRCLFRSLQWWPIETGQKNVSFCVSATTEIMKTNNIPLKSPIKLLPEMKKIFLKCSKFVGFKDLF